MLAPEWEIIVAWKHLYCVEGKKLLKMKRDVSEVGMAEKGVH